MGAKNVNDHIELKENSISFETKKGIPKKSWKRNMTKFNNYMTQTLKPGRRASQDGNSLIFNHTLQGPDVSEFVDSAKDSQNRTVNEGVNRERTKFGRKQDFSPATSASKGILQKGKRGFLSRKYSAVIPDL